MSVQGRHLELVFNGEESCSRSISKTVNGYHHFIVQSYSSSKRLGPGKHLSSDIFTVGGYDWAIYFYPNGFYATDQSTFASVYIALESEGANVKIFLRLTLLNQSGRWGHRHYYCGDGHPRIFEQRGSLSGYSQFIRRSHLEMLGFIKDDCLSIHCIIGVIGNHPTTSSDMGLDFKNLLDSEVGSDIVFQVGDETIKAHKMILAARSPVFRAQFHGLIGNPNLDKVSVHDMEPLIFKAMLHYIYSDRLPKVHKIMGSTDSPSPYASTFMVQHLFVAADRFSLDRLKEMCIQKLCHKACVDTVTSTLSLAEQHRCPKLKSFCLKFVAANLHDVMESEGFKDLKESCPSLLSEVLETIVVVMCGKGTKRSLSSVHSIDSSPTCRRGLSVTCR